MLKPGAVVNADSIILRLSDPELLQEIEAASMATSQERANVRRQQLNNQRDYLTEEGRFAELNASYQMLLLRHAAEADMAAKGIVSQLAFNTTVLQKDQLAEQVKLQQDRLAAAEIGQSGSHQHFARTAQSSHRP